MTERQRPRLSLSLMQQDALVIFQQSEAYENEFGLHPNTLRRSSEKAVEKTLTENSTTPVELYKLIGPEENLPKLDYLREQGLSDPEIDRTILAKFRALIHTGLRSLNPELINEQNYRLREYGRIIIET